METSIFLNQLMVIINNLLQNIETYIGGLEFSKLSDILLYNPKEPLLFSSGAFSFHIPCLHDRILLPTKEGGWAITLRDALLLLFLL